MKLKHINTFLVVIIFLINAYVVVMPFLPAFTFQAQKHSARAQQITHTVATAPAKDSIAPDAETLLVPSMVLDTTINEGPTITALRYGAWRIPYTSTPDKGGNTVIAGHRYTYTNPRGIFYHLDQIHVGDPIAILWHGKKYTYKTTESKVVPPTQLDVESPTATPTLTLYTCTPLWNPEDRLVVVATLESIQ